MYDIGVVMDLTQFSKQQLEQELARREEVAKQEALSLREQGFAMLLKHRDRKSTRLNSSHT